MGRRLSAALAALAIATLPSACGGARPSSVERSETQDVARSSDAPASFEPAPRPARVRVRAIFVSLAGRTRDAAEERARMLARTARADDFSQLASEYGDGGNASNLGSAGLLLEPDDPRLPDSVREAAFALDVREISRPLESAEGFWVLQRLD